MKTKFLRIITLFRRSGAVRRLNSRAAFTLAETLVAILVMTMLFAMLAGATNTALSTYAEMSEYTESSILASTLKNAISAELRFATAVHVSGSGAFNGYDSSVYGPSARFMTVPSPVSAESDRAGIVVSFTDGDGAARSVTYQLIGDSAYTCGMEVADIAVSADESTGMLGVSFRIVSGGGRTLRDISFNVRALNADFITDG